VIYSFKYTRISYKNYESEEYIFRGYAGVLGDESIEDLLQGNEIDSEESSYYETEEEHQIY